MDGSWTSIPELLSYVLRSMKLCMLLASEVRINMPAKKATKTYGKGSLGKGKSVGGASRSYGGKKAPLKGGSPSERPVMPGGPGMAKWGRPGGY